MILRSLLALVMTIQLHATDPWTPAEIGMEVAYQTLLVVDWKQTSQFHKASRYDWVGPNLQHTYIREINPFLPLYAS
jgi:hypothetical protein